MRNGKRRMAAKLAVTAAIMVAGIGVVSAHAANKLIVKDSTGTTDKFVVTDEGKVGIGISAPIYPIQINMGGPSSASTLEFRNTGNSTYSQYDAPTVQFMRNNISTVNNGIPQNNDRLGYVTFGAYLPGQKYAAGITGNSEGSSWSSTSYPGYLAFLTTPASSAYPQERVRITSTGNVGIGATAPAQKLEVNGGVRLNTGTGKPACDSANGPNIRGTLWFSKGGTGVADKLEVCAKQADENYAWKQLF